MSTPIAILATGHTFDALRARHGDFHDWIAAGLGPDVASVTLDVRAGAPLPEPRSLPGVVITGSHDMVSDRAPWSEALAAWLREAVAGGLPVLGICYGHQLLAHAFGGQVADHPDGLELGTHAVHLSAAAADDPLFSALPPSFDAHLVHRQSVRTLPAGAQLLAGNAHEPHQAFRLGRCAWGVQFHPEFGETAMQAYVDALAPAHGIIPGPVRATPQAAALLRRFAQLVRRLDGGASG
ncbi:glutamine amidotransferase [Caldimonas thermodepolymerans]|uniref:glutamine amidotransferase n=1 Tax=Caldimonas thermodepolymerans TaxID=215580 RepID=UPI0022363F7E|nr:glutamine amidotransferase [Caldimonas thermodepolymerans]UZG44411.1 glutamine amidotransferase [Caldimonas thermodepolymerans]